VDSPTVTESLVRVDLIGVGSGVHDRLAELRRLGRIRPTIEGVDVSAAGTHLRRDTIIPQWFQASKAAAASDGHTVHC